MGEFFEITMDGHVALVTLQRPPVNALSRAVMEELSAVVDDLDQHPTARAVVMTGGAEHFSAGVDIKELRSAPPADAIPRNAHFQAIYGRVERCRLPVVAAVNGYALGGGCELAMACDIRVAASDASFGLPEIALGGLPGIGGMQRLQRLVGQGKAKQLILTGKRVTAPDARDMGLVDEIAGGDGAVHDALELATQMASRAPLSVQAGKRALDLGRDLPLDRAQEIDLRYCGEIAGTEDRLECLQAFLEKREPRLVGR